MIYMLYRYVWIILITLHSNFEDPTSLYIDGICEHLTSQKIHFKAFCNGPSLLNACQSRCFTHSWLPVTDICVSFGKMGQQCKLTGRRDREIVLAF